VRASSVVLVGLSGAGKSTVGPLLAQYLGWRFLDFDEEIARDAGTSIAEIFRTGGETSFRERERRLTRELSSVAHTVVAPGGGWITDPGALAGLPRSARVIWLRVSPEEAVRRLRGSTIERPLLAGPDPLRQALERAAAREPLYRQAHHTIDVDARAPADIVRDIAALLEAEADGDSEEG
jgi:shikimate kinase